jgi:hypothetical protein
MKIKPIDIPDAVKLSRVREAHNSLGGDAPLYTFVVDGTYVLVDGGDITTATGRLRNWLAAHMVVTDTEEGKLSTTGDAIIITGESGVQLTIPREPTAELPLKPETPVAADAPPTLPEPDLPRVPDNAEEWRTRIASAASRQVPQLPPVEEDESVAAYSDRALVPLSLTIAEVAKEKTALEAALAPLYSGAKRIEATWLPVIEGGGITLPGAPAPNAPSGDVITEDGKDIAIIAHANETAEQAVSRVMQQHPTATTP